MWNSYNILTFTILRHFRTVPMGTVCIFWFILALRNFLVGTVKKPPCIWKSFIQPAAVQAPVLQRRSWHGTSPCCSKSRQRVRCCSCCCHSLGSPPGSLWGHRSKVCPKTSFPDSTFWLRSSPPLSQTYPNGGGPNCRYTCRYSIFCCLTRMGVDLSKWGWTKWIGMPVDIPFSAVYLGSFLFPFVSEKIFHCKPNLAQSLNLYSTHCVDNLSCPW